MARVKNALRDLARCWKALDAEIKTLNRQLTAFTIVIRVSREVDHVRLLSAITQGVGYVAAAIADPLTGALHEATASWDATLVVIAAAAATYGTGATIGAVLATDAPRTPGRAARSDRSAAERS